MRFNENAVAAFNFLEAIRRKGVRELAHTIEKMTRLGYKPRMSSREAVRVTVYKFIKGVSD